MQHRLQLLLVDDVSLLQHLDEISSNTIVGGGKVGVDGKGDVGHAMLRLNVDGRKETGKNGNLLLLGLKVGVFDLDQNPQSQSVCHTQFDVLQSCLGLIHGHEELESAIEEGKSREKGSGFIKADRPVKEFDGSFAFAVEKVCLFLAVESGVLVDGLETCCSCPAADCWDVSP